MRCLGVLTAAWSALNAYAAFAIVLGALGMLDELEHHDSACYTRLLRTHHPPCDWSDTMMAWTTVVD